MNKPIWNLKEAEGPLLGAAIHDGHAMRENLAELVALPELERLREEDPCTGGWAAMLPAHVAGTHSRFQVDLNRPREKCVYRRPEDAWGLQVWKADLPAASALEAEAEYDAFYGELRRWYGAAAARHGRFFVYDLHTYNHRREGPEGPLADLEKNPEVNIGTGTMDREKWAPLVDRFMEDLRRFDFGGRHLDVRENVKFQGGQHARWTHENFPDSGCCLAIEFKKFFMDEWTGQVDEEQNRLIARALASTLPGALESLAQLNEGR